MIRLYMPVKNFFAVQRKLQSESTKLFQWFHVITILRQIMLITNDSIQINVEGSLLSNEKTVKLLGIIVDT